MGLQHHGKAAGSRPSRTRPTSVAVIGWVWVVLGTLMTFSALMGLAMWTLMREEWSQATSSTEGGPAEVLFTRLFAWYPVLTSAQTVLSPFIVWSAVQFLRLRRWARMALEIVNWLALAYVIAFCIFFIYAWNSLLSGSQGEAAPPPGFGLIGTVGGLFNMAFFGFPLVLMLRYLRCQAVREACSS